MARDYFIIDCETHPMNMADAMMNIGYFRDLRRARYSFDGCKRPFVREEDMNIPPIAKQPDGFLHVMDEIGVDMYVCIPERFLFASGGYHPWVSNGWMLNAVSKAPDRLIMCPNFGPVMKREMKDVLWEMEFMAKERGVKVFKWYCPEDAAINDRRLWPFYDKAQELGLVMQVHTGLGYVYGAKNRYCHPGLLEDVVYDFYDLRIVAFHCGWPYHHELNMLAAAFPNLYVSLSFQSMAVTWRPRLFQELLGELMLTATSNKIIWGTDVGYVSKSIYDAFKELQFDEDLQKGYGYPAITEEDKAKILGLNMAKLLGIEPTKRAKKNK